VAAGSAYVYTEPSGGWASSSSPAAAFTVSRSGQLGYGVSLAADGETALLGAPVTGSQAGAA
jgi:hypothetical protein